MKKGIVSVLTVWILVNASLFSLLMIKPENEVQVSAATIIVDDDGTPGIDCNYTTIQEGIDAANPGDTVFVKNGTYYESVDVNKIINLTGEDRNTTYIDATGKGNVITVHSDWVNVSGFSLTSNDIIPSFAGISIETDYNTIYGNIISSNIHFAMLLDRSSWNTIYDNNISNLRSGITLLSSYNNTISNNYLYSKGLYNIQIWGSKGNNLINNEMIDNGISIGGDLQHWNENYIDSSNFVNGKPVYYWKNTTSGQIPLGAGQVILANCSNVSVEDQILINCSIGIQLGYSSYINISGNLITQNSMNGIYLLSSNKNNITGNDFLNNVNGINLLYSDMNLVNSNNISNNDNGIYNDMSSSNFFINNIIINNTDRGIDIIDSIDNDIIGNNISKSEMAIHITFSSHHNSIVNNNVSNNGYGIYIENSDGNNITDNYFSFNSAWSISLWNSLNNRIYHNNIFIYTPWIAYDDSENGNNWDNDYPLGGNFWSDYSGIDNNKGPYQDIPGSDGIGDTNYSIDLDSVDNYPLTEPYSYKLLENFTILKQGWNLISIPLIQEEQNLTRVLGSIDSWYNAVQWYNITNPNDPWKDTKIGKPFGNDLSKLNETMSFWVHITQPEDTIFLYTGSQPASNQTIQLHPGWNMVGYPSLSSHNRTTGLNNLTFDTHVDAIQWYDAASKTWHFMGPDDSFVPGRGYWVHSKVDVEWEVPL